MDALRQDMALVKEVLDEAAAAPVPEPEPAAPESFDQLGLF
jgi:hypothetical protein